MHEIPSATMQDVMMGTGANGGAASSAKKTAISPRQEERGRDGRPDALLVNPPTPVFMGNKEFLFPPSLLYLASYAGQFGFRTALLDLNLHLQDDAIPADRALQNYLDIVGRRIEQERPRVLGVGCLFSGQFPFVDAVTRYVKSRWPEMVTCIGGIHPTLFAREILTHCPYVDYVVIGEGEERFVDILRGADESGRHFAGGGVGFRENGAVVVRDKSEFIANLDALPMPAYSIVNFDEYRHDLGKWHNPKGHFFDITVPLITSRSCPNRCNFCSMFLVMGPRFRARTAENVLQEMEYLYFEHGIRHFTIMDDNFTYSKTRTMTICNAIVQRGLDIQFDTPNGLMVRTLDQEVVDALAAAGWIRGSIAIESGSDFIRNKVVGKHLSRDKIFQVLELIAKHPQIFLRAYFIMGFPEETLETLADTHAMIEQMHIDDIYVNNLLPFPGTKLYAQCVRDDLLLHVDTHNIWRADCLYMNGNDTFFVKPYAMTVEELTAYRARFDTLLHAKRLAARARRAAGPTSTVPVAGNR